MKVFLDTWVLIEKCKENPDAERLLEGAKNKFEAHISCITVAELMNIISREYGEREARVQYAYLRRPMIVLFLFVEYKFAAFMQYFRGRIR